MNKKDEKLLGDDGWTVDCESPFELSREDGSRATLAGAEYVMEFLRRADDVAEEVEEAVCIECGEPATNTLGTHCEDHEYMVY